jgi:RNA polymerase sigma factor (TIGR02999 family)
MTASSTRNVTKLLLELREGDEEVFGDLFERVYTELKGRARRQRRRWKGEPSLRTTALMHEAYLKLVAQEEQSWESRTHFLAVAGTAMRHILVDRARRKTARKRGGDAPTRSLEALRERLGREVAMSEADAEAFVLLEEALGQLEEARPRAGRVVECRFFSGMTIEETAEALGVSGSTVSRDWQQAKAWLYREMKRIRDGERPEEGRQKREGPDRTEAGPS